MGKKAELTKAYILEVSISEFARRGFDGVRMDILSRKANINKERIYAYYKSKKKLYAAVVESNYRHLIEAELPLMALTVSDAHMLAERMIRLYFRFHRTHPEFSRILAWENLTGGKYSLNYGKQRKKIFDHLRGIYQDGIQRGIFKSGVSFETFFFTITATVFFYFMNLATMSRTLSMDLSKDEVSDTMVSEILLLIRGSA